MLGVLFKWPYFSCFLPLLVLGFSAGNGNGDNSWMVSLTLAIDVEGPATSEVSELAVFDIDTAVVDVKGPAAPTFKAVCNS